LQNAAMKSFRDIGTVEWFRPERPVDILSSESLSWQSAGSLATTLTTIHSWAIPRCLRVETMWWGRRRFGRDGEAFELNVIVSVATGEPAAQAVSCY
jgi:hypothetical protein